MAVDRFGKRVVYTLSSVAISAAMVAFTVPLTSQPARAASGQVVSLNNDGVKALNAGNFQLAIQKFKEALKLDSTYGLARENLAIAYNNYGLQLQNNPKEAIKQFHEALFLNRNNATTLNNLEGIIQMMHKDPHKFADRLALGDEARLNGDFVGAAIEYSEALKLKDDPKLHVKLGDVYRVRDDTDDAIAEYKAATRSGDTADIEVKLGQAYQAKKDLPNAIASYGRAIELKPDDPDVLDALKAGWEEALKDNPTAPENHIGLGQALQYMGDFDQALAEYNQALFFDRNNQTAKRLIAALPAARKAAMVSKHVDAGVDLQSRKLYDQAIQEYQEALKNDPRNATIWVNIGSAYQQKEDYDNAIQSYNQALKLDANNAAATQGIKASNDAKQTKAIADASKAADDAFKLGNYAEAIQKYGDLLKINPQDSATHFNLGACYQANKQIDDAIAEYRQAISLDPKNKDYPKALDAAIEAKAAPIIETALKRHKDKDYAAAIDLYQQAISLKPKNAGLWYNMAGAYYAQQNYDKAKDAYAHAVEIDPKGQVGDLYSMALIDENADRADSAMSLYQKYLAQAPTGQYSTQAKERLAALTKNPKDTIKIKSEAELAKIKEAQDAYQQAVQLQQQQKWDDAIALYQKAINDQPQEAAYPYALGTLFQAKGDLDLAIKWYQTAQQLDPKNKEVPKALAAAFDLKAAPIVEQAVKKQQSGDYPGAIDLYDQALQLVPQNAQIWTDKATAFQNSDDFQSARDAYQKALDLDAKSQSANYYFIGTIDENFGKGQLAVQDYQKYVAAAPTGQFIGPAKDRIKALSANPSATNKLQTQEEIKTATEAGNDYDQGVKLQTSGKLDEALDLYKKANALMPKVPDYAYAIGTVYQNKNDFDNAIQWYQTAQQLNPKNKDYQKAVADANELKAAPIMDEAVKKHTAGDLAGAIPLYQQALAITPNNAHGWTNLAGAYQANDDFANARATYEKALNLDPKNEADNRYFIAALDENANQGAKALQEYMQYVQTAPRGSYVAMAQGRIKALQANPNAVQKIVTAAEQKKSSEAQADYDEAVKLQTDNKLDDAIAKYQAAIAINPNEPSYYYAMGTAFQAKNDLDSAMTNYNKAATLNPKEPSYKQVIAQVKQLKAQPLVDSAIKKQTVAGPDGKYDLPGAIADYEAALKLNPDDADTHLNLGTAYQANNMLPKALAEYNRALQLDSKKLDAHYYMGTVYEGLNQPAAAIASYKKYLAAAPTGQNANECKARIKALTATK